MALIPSPQRSISIWHFYHQAYPPIRSAQEVTFARNDLQQVLKVVVSSAQASDGDRHGEVRFKLGRFSFKSPIFPAILVFKTIILVFKMVFFDL